MATSYNNIGYVHSKKGEYDKALEYNQKALTILLKKLGPNHPDVANSYHHIGIVHFCRLEFDKGRKYFQKSHAILLKKFGANHPQTKSVKSLLDLKVTVN